MGRLIVPLSIKVMLVGKITEMNILSEQSYLFNNMSPQIPDIPDDAVEPDIMSVTNFKEEDRGAYIHFCLPDALTKGVLYEGRVEPDYPDVPNRWMVTRLWTSDGVNIQTKSFLIESDVLQEEVKKEFYNLGSASYPFLDDNETPFRYIGRTYPGLIKTEELPVAEVRLDHLTAIAPANPCFAAFYRDCCNVFGFFDDLKDEQGNYLKNVSITYSVCGWYSDEKNDILSTIKDKEDCLKKLSWTSPKNFQFPAVLLCHGLVCDIKWTNENTDYTDKIPYELPKPELAIGNTSMEALAAYSEFKVPKGLLNERITNLMLCDTKQKLQEPNGLKKGIDELHKARFGNVSKIRKISIKEKVIENQEIYMQKKNDAVLLNDDIILQQQVDRVNELEIQLFMSKEELEDYQEQLYDIFYKYVDCYNDEEHDSELLKQYRDAMDNLGQNIQELQLQIKELIDSINEIEKQLRGALTNDYDIIELNGSRFWKPNDPVLMMLGINRDYSHGEDGRFSETNSVACRDISQLITCLTLEAIAHLLEDGITLFGKNLYEQGDLISIISNHNVPSECIGLTSEAVLLSPSFADVIARAVAKLKNITDVNQISLLASIIRILQTAPVNGEVHKELDKQELSNIAGFDGVFPEIYSVTYWKQPWSPLYLCWKLAFIPDPNVMLEKPNLDNWKLIEEDYVYNGVEPKMINKIVYQGRTVLTPYATQVAAELMKEELQEEGMLKDIQNMSVLSQKIDGFSEKLLMRYLQLQTPIMLRKISNMELKTKIDNLLDGYNFEKPVFNEIFLPIRAGFMQILQVHVVDNFGQTMQMNEPFNVIVAEDFRNTSSVSSRFIILPPRILQPSRLNFQWKMNENTPICGWLLPNHIEKSIHCYDKSGILLGSLQEVAQAERSVVWKMPPEQGGMASELPKDMDETLYQILDHIILMSKVDSHVLEDLLIAIDGSLWNINPLSEKLYQELSLYVGRPLAVVRSSIKLELLGKQKKCKIKERSVKEQGIFKYPHLEMAHFQVNVGRKENHNDGLIGFFKDNNYSRIYLSAYKSESENDYFSNDNFINLCPGAEEQPTDLTFIMDTAGCVDFVSGILPVKSVKIDEYLVKECMNRLFLTIFSAPVLTDVYDLSLPFPKTSGKEFKWIYLNRDGKLEEKDNVHHTSDKGFFPESPFEAVEGWLKLHLNSK